MATIELEYDQDIVRRNIKVRLAFLGMTLTDLARAADTFKQSVHRRLHRMVPVDIEWWSHALAVSPKALKSDDATEVLLWPEPDPDWWNDTVGPGLVANDYEDFMDVIKTAYGDRSQDVIDHVLVAGVSL